MVTTNGFQERPWFIARRRYCLHLQFSWMAYQVRSSRIYPALGLMYL